MSFAELAAAPPPAFAGADLPLENAAEATGRSAPKQLPIEYEPHPGMTERFKHIQVLPGTAAKSLTNSRECTSRSAEFAPWIRRFRAVAHLMYAAGDKTHDNLLPSSKRVFQDIMESILVRTAQAALNNAAARGGVMGEDCVTATVPQSMLAQEEHVVGVDVGNQLALAHQSTTMKRELDKRDMSRDGAATANKKSRLQIEAERAAEVRVASTAAVGGVHLLRTVSAAASKLGRVGALNSIHGSAEPWREWPTEDGRWAPITHGTRSMQQALRDHSYKLRESARDDALFGGVAAADEDVAAWVGHRNDVLNHLTQDGARLKPGRGAKRGRSTGGASRAAPAAADEDEDDGDYAPDGGAEAAVSDGGGSDGEYNEGADGEFDVGQKGKSRGSKPAGGRRSSVGGGGGRSSKPGRSRRSTLRGSHITSNIALSQPVYLAPHGGH